MREEIFGPVVAFRPIDSLDEAIAIADETEYGLAVSLVTNDLDAVMRFTRETKHGIIKINCPTGWRLAQCAVRRLQAFEQSGRQGTGRRERHGFLQPDQDDLSRRIGHDALATLLPEGLPWVILSAAPRWYSCAALLQGIGGLGFAMVSAPTGGAVLPANWRLDRC